MIFRLRRLDHATDVGDGLALGNQLLGSFELADDLLRCVHDVFHGGVPGPVWPDEDSHLPWNDFRGPRQKYSRIQFLHLCLSNLLDRCACVRSSDGVYL